MPGRKAFLAKAMSLCGLSSAMVRLRPLMHDEITILAYHRVLDVANEDAFDFDLELISASVPDFRWQMTYIRKRYTPVTFSRLLDHLDGKRALPPRPILITFDDGFDDNYHHAFPVLKSLGMSATVFLSTGYIGQPRTFWFDWLAYLYHKAAASRSFLHFAGATFTLSSDLARRRVEIVDLFDYVKKLPDDDLRGALSELETHLGINYPAGGFAQSRPLEWDQVREMASQGIEFGSHAVTHPILTNVSDVKLREELTVSKEQLEREIASPVETIAYPVGYDFAFNEKVVEAARMAGYRLGVSYLSGVNAVKHVDPFRLRRLRIERYVTHSDFQGMLAWPEMLA
jgi:peptidoglycan/xylan/chitin deacetylase (PgdA/CDA1 family)